MDVALRDTRLLSRLPRATPASSRAAVRASAVSHPVRKSGPASWFSSAPMSCRYIGLAI